MYYCSCPTVRDWIAMYPALFSLSPSSAFSPLSLPFLSVYHIFSFSLLPHGFSSTFLRSFHCHFCITFLISFFLLTSSASFFFTDTLSLSQPLYVILLLQFLHSSVSFSFHSSCLSNFPSTDLRIIFPPELGLESILYSGTSLQRYCY